MMHRRAFLERAGAASAAGLLARVPANALWRTSMADLYPEPDAVALRALASKAIDAARSAGADFADVRLAVSRSVLAFAEYEKPGAAKQGFPYSNLENGYGIRALVGGGWGFARGVVMTDAEITRVARNAVAAARGNRPLHRQSLDLAPVPSAGTATWSTPIERDPFTVPLGEQGDLALEASAIAANVPEVFVAGVGFEWRRATWIFIATDGRCYTQFITFGRPYGSLRAAVGDAPTDQVRLPLDSLRIGGHGYEAVRAATLVGEMKDLAGRARDLARAARNPVTAEVGRYDIVFDASAVAGLLNATIVPALNLPRALGYNADEGTSFAAPPEDILGKYQIASPLLTLRADRTQPHAPATVKWDEEGVEPDAYTFVEDGKVVDYHTDRETAATLADWYRSRGMPVRSHGCLRRTGDMDPGVRTPNITMAPGNAAIEVDDLIKDVKRGFFIETTAGGRADQQYVTSQDSPQHFLIREIRRGVLGSYVKELAYQIMTVPFWKSVDAIGGSASVRTTDVLTDLDELYESLQSFPMSLFATVPMRARNVNVLNTGRTA